MKQAFHLSSRHTATIDAGGLPTKPITSGGFFDTLPVEILVTIFEYCPSNLPYLPTPSIHEAPLLLCRVSMHWRRVAMSTPTLWSSFSAKPSPSRDSLPYVPSMKLYLKLSRSCLLSFDVRAANPEHHALVKQTFPLFLSQAHRWHNVSLDFNDTMCQQFLAAPLECNSSMESLYLYLNRSSCNIKHARQILPILQKFPHLRRLKIESFPGLPLRELPWSQLTHIHINMLLSVDECIDILKECLNAKDCSFLFIGLPQSSVKHQNIILPALARLQLCSVFDVGGILAPLTCPALRNLEIIHQMCDDIRDLKAFNEFCVRSACKLETFRLLDEDITETDITQYITAPALQSLKSLELRSLGISVKTLTSFKYDAGGAAAAFMPFLETLRIDVEGVSDGLFCDVIVSRFDIAATTEITAFKRLTSLKDVEVRFRQRHYAQRFSAAEALRLKHALDEKRIEELRKQGLHIGMRVKIG